MQIVYLVVDSSKQCQGCVGCSYQLLECLPSMHKAVGSIPSILHTGVGHIPSILPLELYSIRVFFLMLSLNAFFIAGCLQTINKDAGISKDKRQEEQKVKIIVCNTTRFQFHGLFFIVFTFLIFSFLVFFFLYILGINSLSDTNGRVPPPIVQAASSVD